MAREKEAYRDVLERIISAFPGRDVLTMKELESYLHSNRSTILQWDELPLKKMTNGKYIIHIAALARALS